jgi:hypothetical protein
VLVAESLTKDSLLAVIQQRLLGMSSIINSLRGTTPYIHYNADIFPHPGAYDNTPGRTHRPCLGRDACDIILVRLKLTLTSKVGVRLCRTRWKALLSPPKNRLRKLATSVSALRS